MTIWGENMDAGSMVNVSINVASNRIPCQILERATDRLVCRTGPSFNDSDGSFSVTIDGSTQIYDNFRFKYEYVFIRSAF